MLNAIRVGVPTPLDLAHCVAIDICRAVRVANPEWVGLTRTVLPAHRPELAFPISMFTALASYLVELGLACMHEEVYMQGMRPAALSLAALYLALHAFELSQPAAQVLENARLELLGNKDSIAIVYIYIYRNRKTFLRRLRPAVQIVVRCEYLVGGTGIPRVPRYGVEGNWCSAAQQQARAVDQGFAREAGRT